MKILEIKDVSKVFGGSRAVDNYSLTIEKGHICGLIGRNGAGKTTVMKMLAGLIFPSEGDIRLFGSSDLDEQRKRVSFMIEEPVAEKHMTAYENLSYIRYLRGYPDHRRIDEILDMVGLTDTGKKPVRKFSLGMRQRLGIGMALLTKPEFLVLDEPVNGLDPEGIVEIRLLLKRLAEEENVTILISSHILSEMAELCTDFSIIKNGRLIENLSLEELQGRCRSRISLKTNDINRTAAFLEQSLGIHDYKVVHGEIIHIYEQQDRLEHISRSVTDGGFVITRLCEEGQSLEEYYVEKVGRENE